jgi:putative thiamine transport system permease protein
VIWLRGFASRYAANALLLALVGVPVFGGLIGTLLPAFGYLPSLGGTSFSLESWRALFAAPWFAQSLALTVFTGLSATLLSLILALAIVASLRSSAAFARVDRVLAPLLATPHVALAIGFAFLIAPSGWIARLFSPWATGWQTPPDFATVGDANGVALVIGLMLKEVPYLILMMLAALNQIPARAQIAVARSMGYTPVSAWVRVVLPQVLPQLRLPVLAVLAFSLANVDVALLLGPNNPPPLAVQVLRAYTDYDLTNYFPASAGAVLLLLIIIVAALLYLAVERSVITLLRALASRGTRSKRLEHLSHVGRFSLVALIGIALFSAGSIVIWSFTNQWRFPDASPDSLGLSHWSRLHSQWIGPLSNSLLIGVSATAIAAACVVLALEFGRDASRSLNGWLYAPLIVPQIAFLFGVQVLCVRAGIDGSVWTVIWVHLVFALPYFYLSLVEPWHALDTRYERTARALGAGRWRVLLRVKLPLLLRPILIACAVAFAVSIGQYLATLFAGSGRVATVTTEAVTLASGGDRRTLAVYAVLQMSLPFIGYFLAYVIPQIRFANRRLMQLA